VFLLAVTDFFCMQKTWVDDIFNIISFKLAKTYRLYTIGYQFKAYKRLSDSVRFRVIINDYSMQWNCLAENDTQKAVLSQKNCAMPQSF